VRPGPHIRGRLAALAVVVAGLGVALAVDADNASAVPPVKGARYADTDYAFWVDLRVSRSGRSFNPRRSVVINQSSWSCRGLDFHLGSRRRPVRIRRDGRFRYVRRHNRFALRVSGRFRTRNGGKISFRYRRAPRRRGHPCDDSGRVSLVPQRVREIPFHDCRTHRAKSVLSAPTGRVFWQPLWNDSDGWTTTAYACLFAVDKRFKLAQDEDDDSDLDRFRLVGLYLAYAQAECPMGCGFSIHVRDLRDGRETRHVPLMGSSPLGSVTDLELRDTGSVAWIADVPPYFPDVGRGVWAYDRGGYRRLDGGNISLGSLTLSGATLTWVKDGMTRSATLD
jgi:hypothetical protein